MEATTRANIARFAAVGNDHARRLERACRRFACNECERTGKMARYGQPEFAVAYNTAIAKIAADLPFIAKYIAATTERISYDNLITCNIHTICPFIDENLTAEVKARMNATAEKKVSRAYICKKCGGNSTTFSEHQTRAADEASTIIIQCVECNYSWRK